MRFLRLFNRAHYRTYGTRECERLLVAAGFEIAQMERYKINWLWGLMTTTAHRPVGSSKTAQLPVNTGDSEMRKKS